MPFPFFYNLAEINRLDGLVNLCSGVRLHGRIVMSDYKELLERADEWKPSEHWRLIIDLADALRAVIAERDEARKSDNASGELYQDIGKQLDAAIAERDAAKEANIANSHKAADQFMRADAAEARLAEYERWQGDAEKITPEFIKQVLCLPEDIDEDDPPVALPQIVDLSQTIAKASAAQAAARQREDDAKIADSQLFMHIEPRNLTEYSRGLHNAAQVIAAAIRKGATP